MEWDVIFVADFVYDFSLTLTIQIIHEVEWDISVVLDFFKVVKSWYCFTLNSVEYFIVVWGIIFGYSSHPVFSDIQLVAMVTPP